MLELYKNISYISRDRRDAIKLLETLMEDPNFDPSVDDNKAIILASEFGRIDLVEKLLNDPRVDPSANFNEAIFRAVSEGWIDIVKILLKHEKVNPSDRNSMALRESILKAARYPKLRRVYKEIAKLLLSDYRVEWRVFHSKMGKELYEDAENELRDVLTTSYLSLQKVTPKISIDNEEKNLIPKPIFKKIAYEGVKNDLCSSIKKGNVPPMKLVALAKILKIRYISKMTRAELCKHISYKLNHVI